MTLATFMGTSPYRLTQIDDLFRKDHSYLQPEDECYFFSDYQARQLSQLSEPTQLIRNLKKTVDRKGMPEWHYKGLAIQKCAQLLAVSVIPELLDHCIWAAAPTSKLKADPLYDNRLEQVLAQAAHRNPKLQTLMMLERHIVIGAAHTTSSSRPKPIDHVNSTKVLLVALPVDTKTIVVFDDVLTTGCTFRACKSMLMKQYPTVSVKGVFVARRKIIHEGEA